MWCRHFTLMKTCALLEIHLPCSSFPCVQARALPWEESTLLSLSTQGGRRLKACGVDIVDSRELTLSLTFAILVAVAHRPCLQAGSVP